MLIMSSGSASSSQAVVPVEPAGAAVVPLVVSTQVAPKAATRRLVRQTTDKQVSNKFWDHFRDFTDTQKFVLTSDGLTLEETLMRDTRTNRAGQGPAMGATYYQSLRKLYALQPSPAMQLSATNPVEPIRTELRNAIKDIKSRPVKRSTLIEWLKVAEYGNNRETVGIAKTLLEQTASKTPDQRDLLLAGISWFKRNDVHTKDCYFTIRSY